MSREYIVSKGDCITSIAFKHGFHPATIWNHSENSALREERKEGTVLSDGDRVFIPDLQIKQVSKSTEAQHVFRRKGIPETLRIRFLDEAGKPRSSRRYILNIDGKWSEGKTDSDGYVKASITPSAVRAHLLLYENPESNEPEEYNFNLGYLQPITEAAGIRSRLTHLGYPCGSEQGEIEELTRAAVIAFQTDNNLEASGELNDQTRNKIKDTYGS